MFDIWSGGANITLIVMIVSILVLLPLQLFLCFRVQSLPVRLLPALLFSVLAAVFLTVTLILPGWNGLIYLFFALYAGFMLCTCGLGWGIWAIAKLVQRRK